MAQIATSAIGNGTTVYASDIEIGRASCRERV